jgi:hypothetical protein
MLGIASAWACTCGDPPVCGKIESAQLIFVGAASGESNIAGDGVSRGHSTRFHVVRIFKGGLEDNAFVEIDTSVSRDCESHFVKDRSYLVYAELTDTGGLFTDSCGGTVPVELATGDLKLLEKWARHTTPASIQGKVLINSGQANEGSYDRLRKRLGGAVTALGPDGHSYTAAIDDNQRL